MCIERGGHIGETWGTGGRNISGMIGDRWRRMGRLRWKAVVMCWLRRWMWM